MLKNASQEKQWNYFWLCHCYCWKFKPRRKLARHQVPKMYIYQIIDNERPSRPSYNNPVPLKKGNCWWVMFMKRSASTKPWKCKLAFHKKQLSILKTLVRFLPDAPLNFQQPLPHTSNVSNFDSGMCLKSQNFGTRWLCPEIWHQCKDTSLMPCMHTLHIAHFLRLNALLWVY